MVLVVAGMLLGMLIMQRPWVETTQAGESAKRFSCIGYDMQSGSLAEVYIFDPRQSGGSGNPGTVIWLSFNGNQVDNDNFVLFPGWTTEETSSNSAIRRALVTTEKVVAVSGDQNFNTADGQHANVHCFNV
jgi:hypothetical protein